MLAFSSDSKQSLSFLPSYLPDHSTDYSLFCRMLHNSSLSSFPCSSLAGLASIPSSVALPGNATKINPCCLSGLPLFPYSDVRHILFLLQELALPFLNGQSSSTRNSAVLGVPLHALFWFSSGEATDAKAKGS